MLLSTSSLSHGTEAGEPELPGDCEYTPGTQVGRYVLRERLGGGAMGVVFEAHDPELDRRVAVKVLRSDIVVEPTRTPLEARLLREARAMAQLAHPNVVAVHDVGRLGDRIFVAMELVDGHTLAHWLAEERRPTREIVARFAAAGRGLAAAHAAGLVHRDFKPENVLLGSDGRVRVTDFGLAHREVALPERAAPAGSERARTTTAAFAGTPFYMAPEQLAGERVDARSDQFSFCVAIYAALTGAHPFPGARRGDGARAVPPQRGAMPWWLWRAVRPALSVDRDRRYSSMEVLLSRLERGPRRARQIALAAAAAAALAIALAVVAADRPAPSPAPGLSGPSCDHAERLLAGIWDPQRARALDAVFAATGRSDSAETFASVSLLLDQYARRWIALRTRACESARRSDQAESILNLRIACLDARRSELRMLTGQLASADARLLDGAIVETQALGPLDVCADDGALQRPTEPGQAARPSAIVELDAGRRLSYLVVSDRALWQIRPASGTAAPERVLVTDSAVGSPTLVVDGEGRWQVFVRRVERGLWRGWQDRADGQWHGEMLTGAVTDDPAVAVIGNRLVYFVRKTDGWLWRYWQDAASIAGWSGMRVADGVAGRPGVGLDVLGELYSFVRKADGSLWRARHLDPAGAPDRVVKLDEGVASDPVFSFDTAGKMTYYVRTAAGELVAGYQEAAGSALWHRVRLADDVAGDPALAFDRQGKQICMIRKTDGTLWQGAQAVPAGGPWNEWIISDGIAGDPAVVRDADDRLVYVVRKLDGALWQGRQDAPLGASWRERVLPWSAGTAGPAQARAH